MVEDYIIGDVDSAVQMAKDASAGFAQIQQLASLLYDRLDPGDLENLKASEDYTNFFLAKELMDAITNFDGIFNLSCSLDYLRSSLEEYREPQESSNVVPIK